MSKDTHKTNYLPLILVGLGLMMLIGAAVILRGSQMDRQEELDPMILPPIEVDQPAPELTLFDLDGNQVSLSDFKGQVVLLNNWATWCPPCREEMPEFNAYYKKYRDQGFQVLAVEAGQPEEQVREFVEEQGLEFTILLDPENQSLITFQNSTLPNSFVIDRRGHLRLAWLGSINEPTLEKYLTPILEE
jgi:cytochrome c biogenesis protein CcmG/thiol:disulfide interchange protein DsbE